MQCEKIQMFSDINIDFSTEEFKGVFNNHIVISLNSLSGLMTNRVKRYISFCYHCQKLIKDGSNGIHQHISSLEHMNQPTITRKDFCSNCLIRVLDLKNHEGTIFHKQILRDNADYGIPIKVLF